MPQTAAVQKDYGNHILELWAEKTDGHKWIFLFL